MTGVAEDVQSVFWEGTEDLSQMAFDKPYGEILDKFKDLDDKRKHILGQNELETRRDTLLLQHTLGSVNNPMNYLTPILIVAIIIVAILSTVCICAMGFCWYVRYQKKNPRGLRRTDPESGSNLVSMNNVTEESIQFINNVYKLGKKSELMRSESMRSGSRNSRRDRLDRDESEKSSEVNVPLAGDRITNERQWGKEESDENQTWKQPTKNEKLGWE